MHPRRPWYKRYPADFLLLAQELGSIEAIGLYTVLTDLMWTKRGPIADNEPYLKGLARMGTRKFRAVRAGLLEAGLFTAENGVLSCASVNERLAEDDVYTEQQRAAGKAGANVRTGCNRTRAKPPANLQRTPMKVPPILTPVSNENNDIGATVVQPIESEKNKNKTQQSLSETDRRCPRGSRLPATWVPDDQGRSVAAELGLELEAVLAVFRDHWAAKAGHDAVKADWQATWRNWCRREAGRSMPVGKASAPPRTKLPPAGVNQPSVSSSIEAWVKTLPDTTLGTFDEGVERPVIAGCDVAAVAAAIADEAQLGPGEHDWNPIAEWLRAGYCPEKDILPAIRAVVRRPGYQPPRSLNFFTGAIRDAFGLATA